MPLSAALLSVLILGETIGAHHLPWSWAPWPCRLESLTRPNPLDEDTHLSHQIVGPTRHAARLGQDQ